MLVLSRKPGEGIRIGDDVEVMVLGIRGHEVRLGFNAPSNVAIHRQEIHCRIAHPSAESTEANAAPRPSHNP